MKTKITKYRFHWKDGWIDYRHVPHCSRWHRFRRDREDIPIKIRWDMLDGYTSYPNSADIVEFERISFPDGSCEFVER